MQIEKVNDFWVPSNDVHIEQWKAGEPFTQNKCLNKFIDWCNQHNQKFQTVLDIGAWCGTWTRVMETHSKNIISLFVILSNFIYPYSICHILLVSRFFNLNTPEKHTHSICIL